MLKESASVIPAKHRARYTDDIQRSSLHYLEVTIGEEVSALAVLYSIEPASLVHSSTCTQLLSQTFLQIPYSQNCIIIQADTFIVFFNTSYILVND
jgi:hypothetical protein